MEHHTHHPMTQLAYDRHSHEMPMANMMDQQSDHMINYDYQQQQQQQQQQHESMPMMMMMKMYFHFGLGDMLLFESFVLDSAWKMWLASIGLFLAAILLEMLDFSRGYLSCRCAPQADRHASASSQAQLIGGGNNIRQEPSGGGQQQQQQWSCCSGSLQARADESPAKTSKPQFFPVQTTDSPMLRAAQSSLHFVRTGLSLCLMLVAMTYNLCLIFPILLGSGLGFYIFYRPALDSKTVMCH